MTTVTSRSTSSRPTREGELEELRAWKRRQDEEEKQAKADSTKAHPVSSAR